MDKDCLEYLFVYHLNDPKVIKRFVCLNRLCYQLGKRCLEDKKQVCSKQIKEIDDDYEISYSILPNGWKHGIYLKCRTLGIRDVDQKLVEKRLYRNDRFDGVCLTYHDDGKTIIKQSEYRKGKKHGLHREWYYQGQLNSEVHYIDGIVQGLQKHWHLWNINDIIYIEKKKKIRVAS